MSNKNKLLKHFDFALIDIIMLIISFAIGYYLRHGELKIYDNELYVKVILVAVFSIVFSSFFFEPYKNVLKRGYLNELKSTFIMTLICILISVLYLFLFKESSNYSRATLIYSYFSFFILSYVSRISYKKIVINRLESGKSNNIKSILIICKNNDLENIYKKIVNNKYNFQHISGIYVVDNKQNKKKRTELYINNSKKFIEHISTNWIDDILIFTSYSDLSTECRKAIEDSKIPIHILIKDLELLGTRSQTIQKIEEYNVISFKANERKNYQIFIKRLIDIFVSVIGCIVTLILSLIIGPIIYLKSPGNIIYVSNRVGKNGKVFKFYKFRSMLLNADDLKEELRSKNRLKDGMMFKIDNDPRIIPGIGNFIRKTSLDEFPQFYNVLRGDMSLVGTRPPTLDEWNKYSPYYRSRLSIKPGITGLWQVSGRSNIIDFDEVVKLDNEYIDNFCLKLDIKILVKTIFVIFRKEGSM